MNKFIALTKIQLFDFFGKYIQQLNVKNKYLGLLSLALPALFIFPAYQLVIKMYEAFSYIGLPELTLTYMYISNVLFMFFAALPLIISIFFYSKDLKLLASLPVKVETIIFSKLTSIYIYLLTIACFLFGTAVVVYSTRGELQITNLLIGLLALVLSPLLPMIISALLVIPFMSLIAKGKKRNLLVVIGNLLLLVGILSFQMIIARAEAKPEAFTTLLLQEDGILKLVGRSFPPSIWLTKMIQGSLVDGAIFILLNGILLVLLVIVSNFLYNKAVLSFNIEGGALVEGGKVNFKTSNKGLQIIKRHLIIIFSNPTFMLNTVLTMFLPILMFVLMSFTGEISTSLFESPMVQPYIIYIYAFIVATPAIVGNLSATAITREGRSFWETKILPISTADNIRYRIYTTIILNFAGSIVMAVVAGFYLSVTPIMVLLACVFTVAVTLFLSTVDIIIDIQRPQLNWTTPTAAIKNNMNVVLSLLIRVGIGGIVYLIYPMVSEVDSQVILSASTVICFLFYLGARFIVYSKFQEKFVNIAS